LSKLIYIGAMMRSGSTLIDRLLGELPGVCSIGELVYMWERGILEGNHCGCGEPFYRCPFWREVLSAAFGGMEKRDAMRVAELRASVDRTRFIPQLLAPSLAPAFRRTLDEYLSYCNALYDAVRAVSGCDVIVDSSKNASFGFCLRSSRNLDLRVVHLVRDSRAVAHSWTRKVRRGEPVGPTYMPRIPPAKTAWMWNYQNGGLELLATTGTPTLRVRYEDLVRAPRKAVAEIAQFIGLDLRGDGLDFIAQDGTEHWADLGVAHIASGNPMRFQSGRIRIRMDDEWRTGLSDTHRRTVTALTLPLLRHYGYVAGNGQPG
jgi:hypothetical protein